MTASDGKAAHRDCAWERRRSQPPDDKNWSDKHIIVSRYWDEAFMELATDCVYVMCNFGIVSQRLVVTNDCLLGVAKR